MIAANLTSKSDAINKRVSPDSEVFTNRGSFSGNYTNPLTKKNEKVDLQYAAYEPKKLQSGNKNPLIIWLHGQGEGGTDPDITLLGNKVTALTKEDIQNHFKSGNQKGTYVLTVQAPTYWMDEGDGSNGQGAGTSRYTEMLMGEYGQSTLHLTENSELFKETPAFKYCWWNVTGIGDCTVITLYACKEM